MPLHSNKIPEQWTSFGWHGYDVNDTNIGIHKKLTQKCIQNKYLKSLV